MENVVINKSFNNEEFHKKCYTFMGIFRGINSKRDIDLIKELVNRSVDSKILLTTQTRNEIREKLKLNNPNFSASLKRLINAKILTGDKGVYSIDRSFIFIKHLTISLKLNEDNN